MEVQGRGGGGAHHCAMRLQVVLVPVVLMVARLHAQLVVGYYDVPCPAAEIIIQEEVSKAVAGNQGIASGLLRLHFHDCFVRGCDGSVLIDSTAGNQAEKDAPPNTSLRGFEVVDSAKTRLEQACYRTVSCADILAFAARDSIALLGGNAYQVPAGRKDGNVSVGQETNGNLPPPTANVNQLTQIFASKGLTQPQMVTLSGAHTIGQSHCSSFSSRLYSFGPNAGKDPSMDPSYLAQLSQQCPQGAGGPLVAMDPTTPNAFDAGYYSAVMANRGLLTSDQTLLTNQATASQVAGYVSNPGSFQSDFAAAMVSMGAIGVITGSSGGVRTNCRVANS